MDRRRTLCRAGLLSALLLAAVTLAPAQAAAARLRAHPVRGGVVVRLVGAKPRAVRYTLNGRTVGRSTRAPYGLVLRGYRPSRRGRAGHRRAWLVARSIHSGRRLAAIRLVRRHRPPPGLQPVRPPAPYTLPAGALTVSTAAQLVQALAGPTRDIVVADGVYDNSGPFLNPNGDRVYAEHLGRAIFHAGFSMGGNWGPGHGLLEGLAFDVVDPSKVLQGSIVHVWGTGVGTRVADTTFDGHGVIPAGLLARQVEGLQVQRVVARNFHDWGVIVDPGNAGYTPSSAPLVEDVDSANVTWPVGRASNGTSEACVWIGVMTTVRRIKTRNCAWEGLWVGSGTHDATFEDLDLNESGIGIYVEHFARRSTFRRVYAGPDMDRGATCEWADPAWGGLPACTDDVFEDSYFDTRAIGVYLDQGTTHTTVRRSTFVHQRCGAIGDYAGVGNLWDTTGNDYSGIAAGAVPVYTRHLYSC